MRRVGRILLTNRDRFLFKTLQSYGILTTNQIRQVVFLEIDSSTVLRRLRKLKQKGYIHSDSGMRSAPYVWILKQKAASLIGATISYSEINRNSLEHEIYINDLRLALERSGVPTIWHPGHELKHQAAKVKMSIDGEVIPDGVFCGNTILPGITPVFSLEVELSAKSKRRYRTLFNKYVRKDSIYKIWYLVPNENFGRMLVKLWQDTAGDDRFETDKLCFSIIKDVIRDPLTAIIKSKTKAFRLTDIFQIQNINTAQAGAQVQGTRKYLNNSTFSPQPNKIVQVNQIEDANSISSSKAD